MRPVRSASTAAAVTAAGALLAIAAPATAATATLHGSVDPDHGRPGTPVTVRFGFEIAPDPGLEPPTLSTVTLLLPHAATLNGSLFPVCTADMVNAAKSIRVCPRGSQIGTGRARADVTAVPVYNVPATMTFFNGSRDGTHLTMHVRALRPVDISEATDATLVKTSGRYGYKLVAPLPPSLQEIYPGWFQQVRRFDSVIGATRTVAGRRRGYVEAKRCPSAGRVSMSATFGFYDQTSASAATTVRCRP